ncbi:hypothetical protein EDB86DRAFT_2834752 [Lactarius hatsudake]|nr:hypothetical protein EDB86DRAFT_2834752 [Lactarius hatsudake]
MGDGDEKVGLTPTERDNKKEGLAPLTAGLERDCLAVLRGVNWTMGLNDKMRDYTPAARENGLSLMLRSPGSFHEMSRSLCDLYGPCSVYRPRDASLHDSKGLGNRAGR